MQNFKCRMPLMRLFTLGGLLAIAVHGQAANIAVFGFEDSSCGAWSTSSTTGRQEYYWWFRGFVSGSNFGNPGAQVNLNRMPDEKTLYLFIDKYCREKPLNPFTGAAFNLVKELR